MPICRAMLALSSDCASASMSRFAAALCKAGCKSRRAFNGALSGAIAEPA